MKTEYFIFKTAHLGYATAITLCDITHKQTCPDNLLSITPNLDGTEVIVKVTMPPDIKVMGFGRELVVKYGEAEQHRLTDLLYTDVNWKDTTIGEGII